MLDKRFKILNDTEIAELYAFPKFSVTEQNHHFTLPEDVLSIMNIKRLNTKKAASNLYHILQYGYFNVKHQFRNINDYYNKDIKEDVLSVMSRYMPSDLIPKKLPSRKMQNLIKDKILAAAGFSDDLTKIDNLVLEKSGSMAKITQNPFEIFNETVKCLNSAKMVLPKYSRLQDLIGRALKNEDQRLIKAVKDSLKKNVRTALNAFLKVDDIFYQITELKIDAKSFNTAEMRGEIKKVDMCNLVYGFSKKFIPQLSLSRRMIDYYSDLAKLYDVGRLRNTQKELSYLYLICYVHNRYERLITNLIQGFVYYIDKYEDDGKIYAKNNLSELVKPLDEHKMALGKLIQIFTDKEIMSLSGNEIEKHAFTVMPEKDIVAVSSILLKDESTRKREEQKLIWEYHKNNHMAILINLRPLFMALTFDGGNETKELFIAIKFLKRLFKKNGSLKNIAVSSIPVKHIKPKYLLDIFFEINDKKEKIINPYQYEYYVYKSIRGKIKANTVFVNNSIGYRSFESEINIPNNWEKKSKEILQNLNNPVLLRPISDILNELESILEPLIERTNKRAISGENKNIKITHHRDGSIKWSIPYPKRNDEIDNPFYDQLEQKNISELFDFAEQECNFMSAFVHIKPRNAKSKPDYLGIKGCILANGTTQGIHAFSKRSNLKYQRLVNAEDNYIRLATLRDAADIMIDHIIALPIFDSYNLSGKKHGSSDGTKKKTRRRLLKARFSKKYFGDDVGVVILSMILGHVPFSTKIIGANEHESHFLYPMVHNNTSSIDPDIISTDTAGTNNINDLLYYLIGKIHAPCYRSSAKKTETICGFKTLSHYKDILIPPEKTVNRKFIEQKWPEILPILVSLLSHDTRQEDIIKILSSHNCKSDVKDAIWELNHILKSIHLLRYVDDTNYQRDIRTALNRGEAYHQFMERILSVGGGKFRGMSDIEVEIWNECTRLIALIMIYYNMHLLSKLYETALAKNDILALKYLRRISPVASQHINIDGLYEFSEIISKMDVNSVIEVLERILEVEMAGQKAKLSKK